MQSKLCRVGKLNIPTYFMAPKDHHPMFATTGIIGLFSANKLLPCAELSALVGKKESQIQSGPMLASLGSAVFRE